MCSRMDEADGGSNGKGRERRKRGEFTRETRRHGERCERFERGNGRSQIADYRLGDDGEDGSLQRRRGTEKRGRRNSRFQIADFRI